MNSCLRGLDVVLGAASAQELGEQVLQVKQASYRVQMISMWVSIAALCVGIYYGRKRSR